MINWYRLYKGIVGTKLLKPIQSKIMMDDALHMSNNLLVSVVVKYISEWI